MVIIILFVFAIAFGFYILAQNQINFDGLTEEEAEGIPYGTISESLNYMGNMLIGETDPDPFTLGDSRMVTPLNLIFWFSCFVLIVHFLNMLIAIMGNIFEIGNDTQEQ